MNRTRTSLLAIVGLALVAGSVFLFWQRQSASTLVRLRVVRRAVEEGKPVVFFRVECAEKRLVLIAHVFKVEGDGIEDSFIRGTNGLLVRNPDFWAPSQLAAPMGDSDASPKEFGVIAPANMPVWRLRVWVSIEEPNSLIRFRNLFLMWRLVGKESPTNIHVAAASAWTNTYFRPLVLESDPITNTFAPESFSKAIQ